MNRKCHFPHKFRDSNSAISKNIFRDNQKSIASLAVVAIEKPRKLNGICNKDGKSQSEPSAAEILRRQLEEILKQMLSIWVNEIVSLKNFTNKKNGKMSINLIVIFFFILQMNVTV